MRCCCLPSMQHHACLARSTFRFNQGSFRSAGHFVQAPTVQTRVCSPAGAPSTAPAHQTAWSHSSTSSGCWCSGQHCRTVIDLQHTDSKAGSTASSGRVRMCCICSAHVAVGTAGWGRLRQMQLCQVCRPALHDRWMILSLSLTDYALTHQHKPTHLHAPQPGGGVVPTGEFS